MMHRINDMKTSVHCLVLAALVTILVGGCDSASTEESWFEGGDEPLPTEQTLVMTARILAAKGDYGQAGFIVERMLLEFPDRPGTYTEGAEVLLQEGRVSDAIEFLDLGLERLPGHPVLLNDRGLCQLLNGDLPAASSDFSAALAVDPDDADYVANSALAAALEGREDEARALWSRVLPPASVAENLRIARLARPRFQAVEDAAPTSEIQD